MSLALGGTATMSPYISKFVTFRDGYWQTTKTGSGSSRSQLHSRAVWEHFHGSVPDGMRVHHKDGCHKQITDDRLDNLMLLTEEWNIRFMPTLAKGFDVPEALVTQAYIQTESLPYVERFMAVCKLLAEKRYHETYFGAKNAGAAGRNRGNQQEEFLWN